MDAETRARLMGLFVAEAEEGLATLEGYAEKLRTGQSGDDLAEFGRIAHGLKGAASAVGLADLSGLLHGLEELALRLGKSEGDIRLERHERLMRALSVLQTMVQGVGAGQVPAAPEVESLKQLLAETDGAGRGETSRPSKTPSPPPHPAAQPVAAVTAHPSGQASAAPPTSASSSSSAGASSGSSAEETRVMPEASIERLNVPAADVDETLRLASAVARMAAALQEETSRVDALPLYTATLELTIASERLETLLFNLRMLPAAEALAGLDGEVDRLAGRLGKEVDVSIAGQEVRADRRTLQSARGMIRHLIRNAVDHGIESPDERERKGKRRRGKLHISVAMAESRLLVEVADDGSGFDVGAIRRRLSEQPNAKSRVAALSDAEVLQEFAVQGGSTRESATEISGRGMGLSAVVSLARARGGDFQLRSEQGRGSSVAFTVPLEVYATEVLTVTSGARTIGIPVASVERTTSIDTGAGDSLQYGPTGMLLPIDERIIQFCNLSQVLGEESEGNVPNRFAVVVRADQRQIAFGVDELGNTTRVVPQVVPPAVHHDALVTGVAMLPDRRQLQILNPHKLLSSVRAGAAPQPSAPEPMAQVSVEMPEAAPKPQRKKLEVLLAEDSLATREVLRVLLEQEGYDVRVAGDGEEALARIAERMPDVVVTDFNMPRRDGLSLTRTLRAAQATSRLPVILLTSQDDAASQAAGAAAGADAYLIKSKFNATVLHETLRRLGVEE